MIKVQEIKNTDSDSNSYLISAFADTKAEVATATDISGLPKGMKISIGSDVMTAAGEMAFMKSDGTWSWL